MVLVAFGVGLLILGVPWLLTGGASRSGMSTGMSLFPIILSCVGIGLLAVGLRPHSPAAGHARGSGRRVDTRIEKGRPHLGISRPQRAAPPRCDAR